MNNDEVNATEVKVLVNEDTVDDFIQWIRSMVKLGIDFNFSIRDAIATVDILYQNK